MDIYGTFFLIQFTAAIFILGLKLFNLLSDNKTYGYTEERKPNLRWSILLFIAYLAMFGVGLVIAIIKHTVTLYISLIQLEGWLMLLNVAFLMYEIIHYLNDSIAGPIEAYNPSKR